MLKKSPETAEIKEESNVNETLQNSFFNRNYDDHDESLPPAPVLPVKQKRSSRTFSALERQAINSTSSQLLSSSPSERQARKSSEIESKTTPELPAKQYLNPKSISDNNNETESQSSTRSQSSRASVKSLQSLRSNSLSAASSSAQSLILQNEKIESGEESSRANSEKMKSKENLVLYMECLPRKEDGKDEKIE